MDIQCKSSSTEKMSLCQGNNDEEIIDRMDENENFIGSDLKTEKLNEECSRGNSVTDLVPELKNLQLARTSKSTNSEQLAGYVRAVIPCGTVVVGLAPGGKILDVGTAIFALTDDEAPREIGVIDDIFGSIHEPMYSLQLRERAVGGTLKVDAEVFYLRDHPSTGYISVKREANNRYTIERNTDIF